MTRALRIYLLLAFGWTWLVGLAFYALHLRFDTLLGLGVIALLYMPTPLVAALITERGLSRRRLSLPPGRPREIAAYILTPVVTILAFVLLYLGLVFVGGNLLHLPGWGSVATTQAGLVQGAAQLFGSAAVGRAGTPPPPTVFLLAGIWGAIVAGWTINGLFALGEEYGWRGLMWDELKGQGIFRANLFIGLAWGLWHAPLILQGYNYPGHPLGGVVIMVLFTTGMSFVLTAIRDRTASVLPAAAAHGMFNALASLILIFTAGNNPLFAGPLGILGSALLAGLGLALWRLQSASPGHIHHPAR